MLKSYDTLQFDMLDLLDHYGHGGTDHGVLTIVNEWSKNKYKMWDMLTRHPQYDADMMAVVLDAGYTDGTDSAAVAAFLRRACSYISGDADKLNEWSVLHNAILDAVTSTHEGSATVSASIVTAARQVFPDIKVAEGLKISKLLGRIGKASGYEADGGDYNRVYAMACDGCGVTTATRTTVISVHPLDYLTMSFGHGWRSCHTIDRENVRGRDGEGHGGCYCSGTLSYMLDASSVIAYTVPDGEDAQDTEADKLTRCMFHISEDGKTIVQGRVYPQCSDHDTTLIQDYRRIVQDVVAACIGQPSSWTVKKGTTATRETCHTVSGATHYPDYRHFGTCTVSVLKGSTPVKIRIGHAPICPDCGCEHTVEKALRCDDCENQYEYYCEHCGDGMDEDWYDNIFIEGAGAYCCAECAESDGYRYCEDISEWRHEDCCHHDDYTDEWFYDSCELVVTEDGHTYASCDNAYAAGYRDTYDGEWYPEEDVYYCEHCGHDVHEKDWNDDLECCWECEDEVRAEQDHEDEDEILAPVHMVARTAAA